VSTPGPLAVRRCARGAASSGQSDDPPPPELRARVVELFQDDFRLLESVTHRSFGGWLTASGEPAPAARAAEA